MIDSLKINNWFKQIITTLVGDGDIFENGQMQRAKLRWFALNAAAKKVSYNVKKENQSQTDVQDNYHSL